MDDEDRLNYTGATSDDSIVYMYLLKYRGSFYTCECVEVTKDTAWFQVDPSFIRKGLFPKSRMDFKDMVDLNVTLHIVYHAPITEQ